MIAKLKYGITKVKDLGNALTYLVAMILTIIAAIPLLSKAGHDSGHMRINASAIFVLSMIGLYAASAIYHTLGISLKINKLLRKIDHVIIFILIVSTYTSVCMIVLGDKTGWTMLTLVWGIAIVDILINALRITCPKWLSSLIYIATGWVCMLTMTKILDPVPKASFMRFLAGGIIYAAGGIIYTMKLPSFSPRHRYFDSHEASHLFIMGGSLYHYVVMYRFVVQGLIECKYREHCF